MDIAQYRRIIASLDGSEPSRAALPHAVSLAEQFGVPLVLVRVVEAESAVLAHRAAVDAPVSTEQAHRLVRDERAAAEEALRGEARRIAAPGLRVESTVIQGRPGPAIVELSAEAERSLVVISTRGQSGWRRAVVGSVADYVVRHSRAPVLLVRPPAASNG